MKSIYVLFVILIPLLALAGETCDRGPVRVHPGPIYKIKGVPTRREVCLATGNIIRLILVELVCLC